MDDLYEILGIDKTSSDEEIKRAYRKKAQETHPDTNPENSSEFIEIYEAYSILSDRKSRLIYDTTGSKKKKTVDKNITAIQEIQRIMLQLLEESTDEIFYSDLPARVLSILSGNMDKSKNTIADHKKSISRLRRFKKRFRYKGKDNNDFIISGINGKIYGLTTTVSLEVEKIRLFELMQQLLADYEYEPEKSFSISNA